MTRTILYAFLLFASSARAASARPVLTETDPAARLMEEGEALLRAGDTPRARDAFQRAHELVHLPTTALALATTNAELGHLVLARALAEEAADSPATRDEPASFEEARERARNLEARIVLQMPRLRVKAQADTRVEVDGVELAQILVGTFAPVDPGHHVVRAIRGKETKSGEINLEGGEEKEIAFSFTESSGPLDALPALRTPIRREVLSPIESTGLALGGAGLLVGTVTRFMSFGSDRDAQKGCSNNQCAPPASTSQTDALSIVSTIAFSLGLFGGGISLASAMTNRRSEVSRARTATYVVPWIKPGLDGGTLGLRGGF